MTTHHNPTSPAVESLVDELLAASGMIFRIIDHMTRFHAAGHSHPDSPPIDAVLTGLLSDVLASLTEQCGNSEIEIAAAVLRATSARISEEILLVDPKGLEPDQV